MRFFAERVSSQFFWCFEDRLQLFLESSKMFFFSEKLRRNSNALDHTPRTTFHGICTSIFLSLPLSVRLFYFLFFFLCLNVLLFPSLSLSPSVCLTKHVIHVMALFFTLEAMVFACATQTDRQTDICTDRQTNRQMKFDNYTERDRERDTHKK